MSIKDNIARRRGLSHARRKGIFISLMENCPHAILCRTIVLCGMLLLLCRNLLHYSSLNINGTTQLIDNSNSANENGSPGTLHSFLESTMESRLMEVFYDIYDDSSILYNVRTPQGLAFDWIMHIDRFHYKGSSIPVMDPSDSPTIVQRYILAVVFFATEGVLNDDLGKRFTPDDNKLGLWTTEGTLGFLSSYHECEWKIKTEYGTLKGVTSCNKETMDVTEITLSELGLNGELPEEIGYLSKLLTLDFQDNRIKGSIPQSIGRLKSLRKLELGHNHFEGTVPSSIGDMFNLETLYINYNLMHGNDIIPTSLCELQNRGKLFNIWADCNRHQDPVRCDCCTVCCDSLNSCSPRIYESSIGYHYDDDDDKIIDDDNNNDIDVEGVDDGEYYNISDNIS
mmetsp:Transcript_27981/g.32628  ORF Transcript_27981/g.32628 Transcript_27981/m.32628 type:complete len:397 (-) Transcript_27981:81-1271(-)